MPKDITQAILNKKEDIEKNGLDLDNLLEIKKITEKNYTAGIEKISFELAVAIGGPNIWLKIDEDKAKIYGAWANEADEEFIEIDWLYDELSEIFQ